MSETEDEPKDLKDGLPAKAGNPAEIAGRQEPGTAGSTPAPGESKSAVPDT